MHINKGNFTLKERLSEWKKLSPAQKKPYEEKYRQAKLVYLYKKKLYNQAVQDICILLILFRL